MGQKKLRVAGYYRGAKRPRASRSRSAPSTRTAADLITEQRLGMDHRRHLIAGEVRSIRRSHGHVPRQRAADRTLWRERFHEIAEADAAEVHDLAPALDAVKLGGVLDEGQRLQVVECKQ